MVPRHTNNCSIEMNVYGNKFTFFGGLIYCGERKCCKCLEESNSEENKRARLKQKRQKHKEKQK